MKTKPMKHQEEGLRQSEGRHYFAFFMEQGTGKTWLTLADIERLYNSGKLDTVIIFAPNGVHTNWIRREIPAHLDVDNLVLLTYSANLTRAYKRAVEKFFRPREKGEIAPLRIFAVNYESAVTPKGAEMIEKISNSTVSLMMVADESQRIKNPDAVRTKKLLKMRDAAKYARILSGTPIGKHPPDIFPQFEFLWSGLLGTTSYRAFVAEYADLMPAEHPIMRKMIERNPKAKYSQMVLKDEMGNPRYKNLDKLQGLVNKHSFRVLKKDCLDLPEKIYQTKFFQLNTADRKRYDYLQEELRIDLEGLGNEDDIVTVKALAALVKLQQITSGFVMLHGGVVELQEESPRMAAFLDVVEDTEGQFIVWARFREEIARISKELRARGLRVVEYHGGVKDKDREAAVDDFQAGRADVFVAQQQAGGAGLTLTAAQSVIYYSNDFDLLNRLQSEDRCHRIGTKTNVVYTDICAEDTIDERITSRLQAKEEVAKAILGDIRDAMRW